MGFQIPPADLVQLALTIQVGDPVKEDLNLIIFFCNPGDVNWREVRRVSQNPHRPVVTADISSSPWVYKGCDYTAGAFLGMLEKISGKRFEKMPHPDGNIGTGVRYYQLI